MSYLSEINDPRVTCKPAPVEAGGRVHVDYDGLLKYAGASEVYIHYGADGWQNPSTTLMNRRNDGVFTVDIPAFANEEINICFMDSAGNWDNNRGWNWLVEVL